MLPMLLQQVQMVYNANIGSRVSFDLRPWLRAVDVEVKFDSSFDEFEREEREREAEQEREQKIQQPSAASSSGQNVEIGEIEERTATRISEAGLHFIARHEGFRSRVYGDPGPKAYATIGYGHQILEGEAFDKEELSKEEGWELLKQDAEERAAKYVRRYVTAGLLQHQFDALTSFTFNLGCGSFQRSSLLAGVNKEEHKNGEQGRELVRSYFMEKVSAQGKVLRGLQLRRECEARLFLDGVYDA